MLNMTKTIGEWLEDTTTLHNYAYQLFLNDYKTAPEVMTQYRFVEYSYDSYGITINNTPIKDYYDKAILMIRKDKLENISEQS